MLFKLVAGLHLKLNQVSLSLRTLLNRTDNEEARPLVSMDDFPIPLKTQAAVANMEVLLQDKEKVKTLVG
jgi:hypothetical protein